MIPLPIYFYLDSIDSKAADFIALLATFYGENLEIISTGKLPPGSDVISSRFKKVGHIMPSNFVKKQKRDSKRCKASVIKQVCNTVPPHSLVNQFVDIFHNLLRNAKLKSTANIAKPSLTVVQTPTSFDFKDRLSPIKLPTDNIKGILRVEVKPAE